MIPAEREAASVRHPWLTEVARSPVAAFGELLAGHAPISPYDRADAPDAARMLFGPLPTDDPARKVLGSAILGWLDKRRRQPLPADRHRLQRIVREVAEAFEIVSLLSVTDAAVRLRREFVVWNGWIARLVLSADRDARAEYWRMLALTQPLVAEAAAIAPHGLAPFWLEVCREAGGRLPHRSLSIGLLGLRRLPGALDGVDTPWLAGLAHWALAHNPSPEAFLTEWRPLKQLYPATPRQWRKRVATVLASKPFEDAGIEPPSWWAADRDFETIRSGAGGVPSAMSPPPREEHERLLRAIQGEAALPTLLEGTGTLVAQHRRYAEASGDAFFLIRTFTNLGMRLIRHGTDARHERARLAQALAQEALQWEPHNEFAWSLWRDALATRGALEAAELVGWEKVRRFPNDPQARTQLADLLARQPERRNEAEALYHETIEHFPDNPYARTQLAELLIAQDRVAEAEEVVAAAIAAGTYDVVTWAVQARLRSHAGDVEGARRAVAEGLAIDRFGAFPRNFKSLLGAGKSLPLVSRAFRALEQVEADPDFVPQADPELASAIAGGRARRLRFRLDAGDEKARAAAVAEVERLLREDPTFAYAELLAARQGIRDTATAELPPFAVAFEAALTGGDRDRLDELAKRAPRLEALTLVARAALGDEGAADEVARWLQAERGPSEEPAVGALRTLLRPVLRVIEGGASPAAAIVESRATVLQALRDANEATLGDALLAA